jgi:hypothetical protein
LLSRVDKAAIPYYHAAMTTAQHVQACLAAGKPFYIAIQNKNKTSHEKMKATQYVKTGYYIHTDKIQNNTLLDFASVFTSLQAALKTFRKDIEDKQFRLYKVEFVPSDEDLSQELILAKSVHIIEEVKTF